MRQRGLFPRIWTTMIGERDPVDAQPRELARQGSAMGRKAHTCAFALLVLFSLGSLAALSGEALAQLLAEWQRGQVDVPATINVAVSGLLVLYMDVAALYGASILRVLAARRAEANEKRLHQLVLTVACVLEASTMSVVYDWPEMLAAWLLILARAAAAPLFAVYLSMAQPLPVGPRDILHGVELAAGTGVLRAGATCPRSTGRSPRSARRSLMAPAPWNGGRTTVLDLRDMLRRIGRVAQALRALADELDAISAEHLPVTGVLAPSQAPPMLPDAPPPSPSCERGPISPPEERSARPHL